MANAFAFDDDEPPPPPKKKSVPVKKVSRPKPPVDEVEDEDEEEEPPPPPKKKSVPLKPVARPKPPVEDDDEDEEERPKPKKKPAKPVDEDEDDEEDDDDEDNDDDEDEKPKKKKGKAKKNSNLPLILGLAAVAFVMFIACAGIGGWYFFLRDTPERAFNSLQSAADSKDYGVVYDRLANEDRAILVGFMEMAKADPVKGAALKNLSGRDLFVAVMKESAKEGGAKKGFGGDFTKGKVESTEINGDTAILTVKLADGKTEKLKMVKQDGTWRMKGNEVGPTSPAKK